MLTDEVVREIQKANHTWMHGYIREKALEHAMVRQYAEEGEKHESITNIV